MKLSSVIPWALLLSTDTRKCGGVHRNFSGRISSSFSWGPKCTWTILLKSGYTVVLTIPFLSLNCNEEDVEIIDGPPDSTTFGNFCSGGPLVFTSSSNVMTVKYHRSSNQPVSPFDIFYYERPSGAGTWILPPPPLTYLVQPQRCMDTAGEDSGPDVR
ncbi:hypothetical protein MG293_019321 [Ovis ammon polii]|uniref:CUB domain-containing protein n=1 Tax=Ovis ammon polii TaxID=230172 RepID=A0AAD4TLQ9_OVIAM|nr:hypothetical protein MG293_019321 [Ovis ammon polii]